MAELFQESDQSRFPKGHVLESGYIIYGLEIYIPTWNNSEMVFTIGSFEAKFSNHEDFCLVTVVDIAPGGFCANRNM